MAIKDYYQTLNIPKNAGADEIKHAYVTLVKMFHPDRFDPNREPNEYQKATELIQQILEAYRVLSDPVRRKEYDKSLDKGRDSTPEPKEAKPQNSPPPPKEDKQNSPEPDNDQFAQTCLFLPWKIFKREKFLLLRSLVKNSACIKKNELSPFGLITIGVGCSGVGFLLLCEALREIGTPDSGSIVLFLFAIPLLCLGFYRLASTILMLAMGGNYSVYINSEFLIDQNKTGIFIIPIRSITHLDSTVSRQNRVFVRFQACGNFFEIKFGDTNTAKKLFEALSKYQSIICVHSWNTIKNIFKNDNYSINKHISITPHFAGMNLGFLAILMIISINKVDNEKFRQAKQTNSLSLYRKYIVAPYPLKKFKQEAMHLLDQKIQSEATKLRNQIHGSNNEAGYVLSGWVLDGDILSPKKIYVESVPQNKIPDNYEAILTNKFHGVSIRPIQNEFTPSSLAGKEDEIRTNLIKFIKSNLDPDLIEFHSLSGQIQEIGSHIIRIDYDIVPTFDSLYYKESEQGIPERKRNYFPSIRFNWHVYLMQKTFSQDNVQYYSEFTSSPAEHFSYKVQNNETTSVYYAMVDSACNDFTRKLRKELSQKPEFIDDAQ